MIGMIHRGELDPTTESEIENLVSRTKGHLLTEHNDDGTHGNITATNVTVSEDVTVTGDGTFENVIARNDVIAESGTSQVRLGFISEPTVTDGVAGYGITRSDPNNAQFSIYSVDEGADEFLLFRLGNSIPLRIHKTGGAYYIEPGDATNVLTPVSLGHTLESIGSGRFATVFAKTLDADGLQFPATQVPSADANRLDDYEEGSWTPNLLFGGASTGITYTTRIGTYTKIGNLVHVEVDITLSSKGSATGSATLSGVPFAAANRSVAALNFSGFAGLTFGAPKAVIVASAFSFVEGTATADASLADTNFTNTSTFLFAATYRV